MVRKSQFTVAIASAVWALMSQAALAQAVSAPSGAMQAISAQAAAVTFAAAMPAADKVYPPLPTLAMLPPSAAEEDAPVRSTSHRRKTRAKVAYAERKPAPPAPVVRLIVSDASHTYLDSVQRQLDEALAK